ncbi:aminotransferase class V-fold PLP-dependent enzyme [Marinobacter halodurans]|uniref:Aminotransferase class V-fold PLP-dependent enzyme n=2 Tax=Marinobacter halodurans TaxID=2528979 RepID=A0ABY1ZL19_9GAMM|nr:aminotransferase class V-fold PLP-dependent enzyme [Marinobacter halodurans]
MDLDREFKLDPDISYLNHAAVAPWPARATDAVARFARENAERGAQHYPRWMEVEGQLRENLAQLLNAPSADDIALVKNTSEALSFVAYGLSWSPGDEIIISDQEFPSNSIVWESLADQGVKVRKVSLNGPDCEADIIAAFNERTRLLSISSVQYGTGLRVDLERLGQACRDANVLFCVDAIQSLGALPMDVQAAQIDFTMADGHKWLLGPEGLGVFYVRPELRDQLRLSEYGWHMVDKRGNFDQKSWRIAPSAVRFECGSPNSLAAHALEASTALLLEYGMDRVQAQLFNKVDVLAEALRQIPKLEILSPLDERRRSGILTFRIDGQDSQDLYKALMDERVICANRGGGVRFSPHFYTTESMMGQAVTRLRKRLGTR